MKDFRKLYQREEGGAIFSTIAVKHDVTKEDLIEAALTLMANKERVTKKSVFDSVCNELRSHGASYREVDGGLGNREEAAAVIRNLFPRFFEDYYA
jgi:hypothetical protein